MKYRKMGFLNWEVSVLGFGAMRLPVLTSWGDIDYKKSTEMLRYAIDHGVNYIDTAWMYHEENSEEFVGKALKNGYRKKVKLVTKSPLWLVQNKKDFNTFLNKQLRRLQDEYIDIYLLHGINAGKWQKIKQLGLLEEMENMKKSGKIGHIGFSFHGSYDSFIEIIDAYPWDITQIQYNYLDTEFQATVKGLDYAYKKNTPVVIMEPLRGGKLAQSNKEIQHILESAPVQRTLVDWALQFVWNHPGVCTVLSGMSTLNQVKENIEYSSYSGANSLTTKDMEVIDTLKQAFGKKIQVPCTSCQYCMPCPHGVDIPENFFLLNHAAWEGEVQAWMRKWYDEMDDEDISTSWHGKGKASLCIECGECLDNCSQNIDIPNVMKDVKSMFEQH